MSYIIVIALKLTLICLMNFENRLENEVTNQYF